MTAPPLVGELAIVLISAALIAYLCTRIKLVPIVGFILAGAMVGPNTGGLVNDVELVEQAAEIGVIFLLFGIGLELSVSELKRMGPLMLGGGALQVVGTIGLVTAGCLAFGVDWRSAVFTGCLVSLSSTAIVLKLLSERGETNTKVGEVSVAFLIFQDLAVVIMVLLVPMLGESGGGLGDLLGALLRSAVVIGFVVGATQWFVPRALDKVADFSNDEVFLLSVAGFALVVAYVSSLLGLTDSLGAFIAGVVISSSRHRERAIRYSTPFQMLFSAIFFVSIGMLLDIGFFLERWDLVLVLATGAVVVKVVTASVAARVFRRSLPVAVSAAFLLAQIGEFSFVLELAGRPEGLSPAGVGADGSQAFIATAVVLLMLTPLLDQLGQRQGRRLGGTGRGDRGDEPALATPEPEPEPDR
ncbi:MAG TPA: cation:proton antiporter [Acidimicrobiales bacterium]|nr:cation:proton antiporter [Acidimicrobiales bacterium]